MRLLWVAVCLLLLAIRGHAVDVHKAPNRRLKYGLPKVQEMRGPIPGGGWERKYNIQFQPVYEKEKIPEKAPASPIQKDIFRFAELGLGEGEGASPAEGAKPGAKTGGKNAMRGSDKQAKKLGLPIRVIPFQPHMLPFPPGFSYGYSPYAATPFEPMMYGPQAKYWWTNHRTYWNAMPNTMHYRHPATIQSFPYGGPYGAAAYQNYATEPPRYFNPPFVPTTKPHIPPGMPVPDHYGRHYWPLFHGHLQHSSAICSTAKQNCMRTGEENNCRVWLDHC